MVDWNIFADKVNQGDTFQDQFVKLSADIGPVITMAGSYDESDTTKQKPFKGTFDGDGHSITINYQNINFDYCGPIGYIEGATIKNLTVAGNISSSKSFAGGFVGFAGDNEKSYFTNCESRVYFTFPRGSGNQPRSGGFVGKKNCYVYFENCTFSGHCTGTWDNSGGFVGYDGAPTYINNCLFAPTNQDSITNNFSLFASNDIVTNSYYINHYNAYRRSGLPAYATRAAAQSEGYSEIQEKTFTGGYKYFVPVLPGEGSETDPYRIATIGDWNVFGMMVKSQDDFKKKYVKLTADLGTSEAPVTTVAGNTYNSFKGIFDGDGHTITVEYTRDTKTNDAVAYNCKAPFVNINGATIKNLRVKGSITSAHQYAAGIVGNATENSSLINCVSEVEITYTDAGDSYAGGLIGYGHRLLINNCVFKGKLLATNGGKAAGGLVGQNNGTSSYYNITVTNSLFAPSQITIDTEGSKTLVNGLNSIAFSYYTQSLGEEQGHRAYTTKPSDNNYTYVQKTFADGSTYYVPGLGGSGTQSDPYIIGSLTDWNLFNDGFVGNKNYESEFIKLTTDIGSSANPITTTVGNAYKPFNGTFDGDGHTITVNLTYNSNSGEHPGFFWEVDGATIKNLTLMGSVATSKTHTGGLIGQACGNTSISNCIVGIDITSTIDSSNANKGAGFVGYGYTNLSLSIKNSAFTGKVHSTTSVQWWAGFVGWCYNNTSLNLENCLFAPESVSPVNNNVYPFAYNYYVNYTKIFTNCSYTRASTDSSFNQGIKVNSYNAVADIPANSGIYSLIGNQYIPCSVIVKNNEPVVVTALGKTLKKNVDYTITTEENTYLISGKTPYRGSVSCPIASGETQ